MMKNKERKIINTIFLTFLFLFFLGTINHAQENAGWKKIEENWYYYENDQAVNGWIRVNNRWYYMDTNDGHMLTGWQRVNGRWYYMDTTGSGHMLTGWQLVNGRWYYMDTTGSGHMLNGWQLINGRWYYMDTSGGGHMLTGWQEINGRWYYMDTSGGGHMLTGWQKINGNWYYMDTSGGGHMLTAWQRINDRWYFLHSQNGNMLTGWLKINGNWYYMDTSGGGHMLTGWQLVNGRWYYMDTTGGGHMLTGWQKINNYWYYMDATGGGHWVTDLKKEDFLHIIDGIKEGWNYINGNWYYCDSNKKMLTGWQRVNGRWYYMDTNGGQMLTAWQRVNGRWYYMDTTGGGHMLTGWQRVNGLWYYMDTTGRGYMLTGWLKLGDKWYYLDLNNGDLKTGEYRVGNEIHYSDSNGVWIKRIYGDNNIIDIDNLKVNQEININKSVKIYLNAYNAEENINSVGTWSQGKYFIYKIFGGAINITKNINSAGAWINVKDLNLTEGGNDNVSTSYFKLVFDPGHGGGIAHNRGGVLFNEGDQNFKFTQLLIKEAAKYKNIHVSSTRNNINEDPSFEDRAKAGKGADLYVSIHTNAATPDARGVEIWGSNNNYSHKFGQEITRTWSELLKTPNRGVKYSQIKGVPDTREPMRGYRDTWFIFQGNEAKEKYILESVFHTNYEDSRAYLNNQNLLAKRFMEIVAKHFNLELK